VIRALIFDFDGLIVDTESPEFKAWQAVFDEYGGSLSLEDWARNVGRKYPCMDPYAELEQQTGRRVVREEIRARKRELFQIFFTDRGMLPGVREYLDGAKELGLAIGLASSASRDWIEGHLERLDIGRYFTAVRTEEDVERAKPDPELFLATLAGLEISPEQAIALEDSPNGVMAARRAGLFCLAVPNPITRQLDLEGADWRVDSLADLSLEQLLDRARKRKVV
jgi:HAD superfamily hydrolase (TIGR01509 family)